MYLLDINITSELYKFRNGKINVGVKNVCQVKR